MKAVPAGPPHGFHVITFPMRPDPTRPDTRATAHPVLWLMAFVAILYLSLYPFGEWSLRRPGTFSWLFAYHRLNY